MHSLLHQKASHYNFYRARDKTYETNDTLPFRISPTPLYLEAKETEAILEIGTLISQFFRACIQLYNQNSEVRKMLDKGKPSFFLKQTILPNYLFLRPDLLYTNNGLIVCEIETSPFGLGLAALLNEGYTEGAFKTLVDPKTLKSYCQKLLPKTGGIIYSDKTMAYAEQLEFLADTVFSGKKGRWVAQHIDKSHPNQAIYRAFYLHEYLTDTKVKQLLDKNHKNSKKSPSIFPSLTPHLEEKALLALIWDKRYKEYFTETFGKALMDKLLAIIPPTLIIGQEENFNGSLPLKNLLDIASLPRSQRKYTLKISGFDPHASWKEGVIFLHEISAQNAKAVLAKAMKDKSHLYILQEFIEPKKVAMAYEHNDEINYIEARIRITPYYRTDTGKLLTIKATGCEHTNYIHASSTSINTAVAQSPALS